MKVLMAEKKSGKPKQRDSTAVVFGVSKKI
jgi:hypothetical protein